MKGCGSVGLLDKHVSVCFTVPMTEYSKGDNRNPRGDHRNAWTRWCEFCDQAEVAPDTQLSPVELAYRFNKRFGGMMHPDQVEALMPERQ